jgi:rare lipoprotein A (peptidoglycan hydrolase)
VPRILAALSLALAFAISAVVVVPAAPVAAATPVAAVGSLHVTTATLNARGHPTTDSKALFLVAPGTTVRVYRTATDSAHRTWFLVHVKSRPGWIAGWLTKPRPISAWLSAVASSFGVGDGLVGNKMACGAVLTTSVLAVANRTLPCGTKVRIRVGSRVVEARVMDRGPFTAGRTFDLAPAVCRALASCHGAFKIDWQRAP